MATPPALPPRAVLGGRFAWGRVRHELPPGHADAAAILKAFAVPPDARLAAAQGPAACGTVQFSVRGKQQPALQLTDAFIPRVLKLAGLHWTVP